MVAIYSTLGLAGTLAQALSERELLDGAFMFGFLFIIAAILGSALRRPGRQGRREIWVALGVAAVAGMAFLRMGIGPAERTHLIEYAVVAILIHQALLERRRNGRRVPVPGVLAFALTVVFGSIDEGLQALLPNRVFDPIDMGFNALAALMANTVSSFVAWVWRRGTGIADT